MKQSKKGRNKSKNRKDWLLEASRVHRELQASKMDIDKIFPAQEYLHPLSRVASGMQIKIAKFLRFKIDRLVVYDEVKGILEDAKKCKIDKGNILYTELKTELKAARNLKEIIKEFEGLTHRTYAEAKYLFAQVLKTGIWMNTARVLKKIINVNTKIENFLMGSCENNVQDLQELTQRYSEFIDSGFKKDISFRHQEIEKAQKRIDLFLNRKYVDFIHFEPLEQLMKEINNYPYTLPHFSKIKDLHSSFVWVIKLALKLKVKTKSLPNLVEKIKERIRGMKDKSEYSKYENILRECLKIKFSKSPIADLIHEVKLLFWAEEARSVFERKNLSMDLLESLLGKVPNLPSRRSKETHTISMVSSLVEKAKNWLRSAKGLSKKMENMFKMSLTEFQKEDTKGELGLLETQIEDLMDEYSKDLTRIKEFKGLNEKLHNYEDLISFFRTTYSIFNSQKIELNDYQKSNLILKFLDKQDNMSFKGSKDIVEKFRKLKSEINSDMKTLQKFYRFIQSKKSYVTPKFFDVKFKEYVLRLQREKDVENSVEVVSKHIFLSELGFEIKDFLKEFKNQKNQIEKIIEKCSMEKLMGMNFGVLKKLKSDFEKARENFVIRVGFEEYERFEVYEWCLNCSYYVKSDRADVQKMRELEQFGDIIGKIDKKASMFGRRLRKKLEEAENLSREIDEFMMKKFKKEEILKKLDEIENGNLVLKSKEKTLRKLLKEYTMLQEEIQGFREELEKGEKKDFRELRGLYNDLVSSRFILDEEEEYLRQKMQEADDVIQAVLLNKEDKEALNTHLVEYRKLNVVDLSIERVLQSEEKAKNYLKKLKNLERMSLAEVKKVEKMIAGVFYPQEYQDLSFRIFKRQIQILQELSKKTNLRKKRHNQNLVSLEKLKAICDIVSLAVEDINCDIFSPEDQEWCANRLSEAEQYLESLENRQKPKKIYNKILFNFLDLRKEIQELELRQADNTLSVINVEVPEIEIISKEEKRSIRKGFIKEIKGILKELYNIKEKNESVEKAKEFEMAIYSDNKVSMLVYKERVQDYIKVLRKCSSNLYLNQLLGEKVLKSEVVSEILKDDKDNLTKIKSLKEARKYVRMLSAMSSEHGSKTDSALRKREHSEVVQEEVSECDKVVKKLKEVVIEGGEMEQEEEIGMEVEEVKDKEEEDEKEIEEEDEEQKEEGEAKKEIDEVEKEEEEIVEKVDEVENQANDVEITNEEQITKTPEVEEVPKIAKSIKKSSKKKSKTKDKTSASKKKMTKRKITKKVVAKKTNPTRKAKEEVQKEPENPSGLWTIFEGNIKINMLAGLTEPASLISSNAYQKITKTPTFNFQTLEITEFIKLREFEKQLQNLKVSSASSKKLIKLSGFIHLGGSSKANLAPLAKVRNNVYRVNIDELNLLYIFHYNEFLEIKTKHNDLKNEFLNYEKLADIDAELYFILLSSPNGAIEGPVRALTPKIFDKEVKKREQNPQNLELEDQEMSEEGASINWEEARKKESVQKRSTNTSKKSKAKDSATKKEMDSLLNFNLAMSQDDNFDLISQQEDFDVIANANKDLKQLSNRLDEVVFKDATNLVNNRKTTRTKMGKLSINSTNLRKI